ncbi:neuropeptide F receptor [Eurytemora carolleeae]|uniref:neuropeptide F receptor n=1 Tax=Eurytemora carolleeae TaxID=1294199 RepID=UPI000C77474E|nr:neuropeptide F receptor [Eurytemora carolleeae]|eukprot:XP_023321289.1 neuropeptide F receptor-like [Eurytemora affinis]
MNESERKIDLPRLTEINKILAKLMKEMQAHFGSESIISPHNKTELNANETWFTGVIDSDLNNQSNEYESENSIGLIGSESGFELLLDIKKIQALWQGILIFLYTLMMVIGFGSNLLILWACFSSKMPGCPRNIFLMNTAISGIFLCVVAMPLTLIDQIHSFWVLGNTRALLCKSIGTLQSTCVFFSTYSVLLIALDRFFYIIKPCNIRISSLQALIISVFSFFFSYLISLPLFFHTDLMVVIKGIKLCHETWVNNGARIVFTVSCFVLQYLLPSLIILRIYLSICRKFKNSQSRSETRRPNSFISRRKMERRLKTNRLLISASVVFFLSWLPLNIFNLSLAIFPQLAKNGELVTLMYSFCHLCAMSTSCSNPIIYGFFNNNYKQFFNSLLITRSRSQTIHRVVHLQNMNNRSAPTTSRSNGNPTVITPQTATTYL